MKASQNREERLGDSLLDDMRRVQREAWELLSRTESEGDHRGSIVALREVRECLQSLGEMLAKAHAAQGPRPNLGQVLEAARRRVENMSLAEVERRIEELSRKRDVLQASR